MNREGSMKNRGKTKRNMYWFSLLFIIIFLLIFYQWFFTQREIDQGNVDLTTELSITRGTRANANLMINSYEVEINSLGNVFIHLNLIIENIDQENFTSTDIVIPWTNIQLPIIDDLKIEPNNVYVQSKVSEYAYTSEKVYILPVEYKRKDTTEQTLGLAMAGDQSFSYIHDFGKILTLNFPKAIPKGDKQNIDISFTLRGIVFERPTKLKDFVHKIVPLPPIDFYPFEENRLKLILLFPEFQKIELNELFVKLPHGYSAISYQPKNLKVSKLNRELKPTTAQGFVSYINDENFNDTDDCTEINTDLFLHKEVDGVVRLEKEAEGCVLKYNKYPLTKDIINGSFNWYLSARALPVSNELSLMRFRFNPSFIPAGYEIVGHMVLVDYKIKWWNNLIPLILVVLTIIVSIISFNSDLEHLQRIALLIPLILAIFTSWASSILNSPPIHPNLIDTGYLIALFIAISSMMGIKWKDRFRVFYPLSISFASIFLMHATGFSQDWLLKLAITYPIISFSLCYPSLAAILSIPFVSLLHKMHVETKFLWLWFARLISVALLFPLLFRISSKFIKFKRLQKFFQFYFSFVIIWNIFFVVALFIEGTYNWGTFINYFVFLPVISYLLLQVEDYVYHKLSKRSEVD